jgi:hypothetical protein
MPPAAGGNDPPEPPQANADGPDEHNSSGPFALGKGGPQTQGQANRRSACRNQKRPGSVLPLREP